MLRDLTVLGTDGAVTGVWGLGLAGGPCSGRILLGPIGTGDGISILNWIDIRDPGLLPWL